MKDPIYYINRQSKKKEQEKIYHAWALKFLYRSQIGQMLATSIAALPSLSSLYGWYQRLPISKRKIKRFVKQYGINPQECSLPLDQYPTFDAFFTRKLNSESRPLYLSKTHTIIPADGRYLFYQQIDTCNGFIVKGKKFSIIELLHNEELAEKYRGGSMAIGRLSPFDYHRFHFPYDCIPGPSHRIDGYLYSVNPLSIKQNIERLIENKREITQLKTDRLGTIAFIEIGATCVGTIHQTYTPHHPYKKGEEKGFFSFGGSSIILLFEPNQILFDQDLVENSTHHMETLCLMGQSMGKIFSSL